GASVCRPSGAAAAAARMRAMAVRRVSRVTASSPPSRVQPHHYLTPAWGSKGISARPESLDRPDGGRLLLDRRRVGLDRRQPLLYHLFDLPQPLLERGEHPVGVSVGLSARLLGFVLSLLEQSVGALLGGSDERMLVCPLRCLFLSTFNQAIGALVGFGEDLVALGDHPPGNLQFFGQRESDLVD